MHSPRRPLIRAVVNADNGDFDMRWLILGLHRQDEVVLVCWGLGGGRTARAYLPSHHQANPLDIRSVQRRRIWLGPSSVCRLEGVPAEEHPAAVPIGDGCRLGVCEVGLPADAALLSTVLPPSRNCVFKRDEVSLGIVSCGRSAGGGNSQEQAIVCRQVPVLHAGAVLRGKTGAPQRRRVEMSVEAGRLGVRGNRQVRDARAAAHAIVRGRPVRRAPVSVIFRRPSQGQQLAGNRRILSLAIRGIVNRGGQKANKPTAGEEEWSGAAAGTNGGRNVLDTAVEVQIV
jgi:hypothetical protein